MKKYKVFGIAAISVLVLLVGAVACGGGGGGGTKTYNLKEDAPVGKGVWKILSAEKSMELNRTDAAGKFKAEGQFVLLQVSLKNNSGEAANLTGEEIEIMDGNRNSYTFDSKNNNIYLAAIGKESLTKNPVPAGQTGTGYLIYDISKDAKDLKAKVKDVSITGRTFAYVDLNM
ncbi:MAG: DUF4352 domain-containing protein [Actinomycetota bacterium]